jgi:glycosyltransferase involved in cell wall biosynthesis
VVGAQAEVVGGADTGRVFDGEDPEELAAALLAAIALASQPATTVACRARAERWSVGACAAAYEALYESVRSAA